MNGAAYQPQYSLVPSADNTANRDLGPATYEDPCGTAVAQPIPENWNAEVAAGKAMTMLSKTARATCNVEAGSVYGVALAMPQFARTAGFSLKYTGLVIRAFFFLVTNLVIQGFLLYMISKEERVMSKYGGQMHLCDFGAEIQNCPDGPNCVGPGGTTYTSARLYNFQMWATRSYVRDAFKAIFPDRAADIDEKIDPGEYGLESYHLRILSCVIFVIGCWSDLQSSIAIWKIITNVPSYGEAWMSYEVPTWDADTRHAKAVHGWTELDLVKFKIAGMPCKWKIVNFLFVLLPKCYLWLITLDVGVVFLLETAVIEDMIINAVALAFILNLDEMICTALVSPVSLYMVGRLEPLALCEINDEENDSEKDSYEKHQRDKIFSFCSPQLLGFIFPWRLIYILSATGFFIGKYYCEHCIRTKDGSWVSRPLYYPESDSLSFLSFLFGPLPDFFPVPTKETVVWEMNTDG